MTAVVPIGFHELPQTREVWRPVRSGDEYGGENVDRLRVGTVRCKISQPAAVEQLEAQQAGSTFSVIVHLRPEADVRRGDELRDPAGRDDVLRVKSTVVPSYRAYLRADAEQLQSEGERDW